LTSNTATSCSTRCLPLSSKTGSHKSPPQPTSSSGAVISSSSEITNISSRIVPVLLLLRHQLRHTLALLLACSMRLILPLTPPSPRSCPPHRPALSNVAMTTPPAAGAAGHPPDAYCHQEEAAAVRPLSPEDVWASETRLARVPSRSPSSSPPLLEGTTVPVTAVTLLCVMFSRVDCLMSRIIICVYIYKASL
jgi:hypothetical protein